MALARPARNRATGCIPIPAPPDTAQRPCEPVCKPCPHASEPPTWCAQGTRTPGTNVEYTGRYDVRLSVCVARNAPKLRSHAARMAHRRQPISTQSLSLSAFFFLDFFLSFLDFFGRSSSSSSSLSAFLRFLSFFLGFSSSLSSSLAALLCAYEYV